MKTSLLNSVKTFSVGLLALACFPSNAQEVLENDGKSIYQPEFFDQYNPQNALEMIERLPGFSFDQGSDARGFGGNAGNVLIDGSRPTSKSGGLRGALVRIPAAQVERIEILRGGVSAGEAAGQSIVANVIRAKNGSSGTWAFKLRQVDGANVEPNLEAALSSSIGDWDTSFDTDIGGWPGFRSALFEDRTAEGDLTASSRESLVERDHWAYINGEGSTDFDSGTLTLNGRFGGNHWRGDPKRDVYFGRMPDDSPRDAFWQSSDRDNNKVIELGADWTQTGERWKWRLIGLGNVKTNNFESFLTKGPDNGEPPFTSSFIRERKVSEYIARTTFSLVTDGAFKPEVGAEVANNKLDTDQSLLLNGEPYALQNATVVVEEMRGETFANMVWEASEALTVEGGVTAEFSQIKLTGDDNNKQSFSFIKPRVSATYRFDDVRSLTVEAQRRVGQLDFNDFAAARNISDNSNVSGNSNLKPDKTNEVILTYDWNFSERGSLKVKAFHEWRQDVLEQIRLSDDPRSTSYGTGNAGSGRFWGVITDLTVPLDGILENGLLELSHRYRGSTFYDPIIEGNRTLSWYTPNWYTFKLRQDLTEAQVSWGAEFFAHYMDTGYTVDERQTFRGNNRWRFFVETTRYLGVKMQLEVNNANTAQYTRTRYIYNDHDVNIDRGDNLVRTERSARFRHPELKLTLSGAF